MVMVWYTHVRKIRPESACVSECVYMHPNTIRGDLLYVYTICIHTNLFFFVGSWNVCLHFVFFSHLWQRPGKTDSQEPTNQFLTESFVRFRASGLSWRGFLASCTLAHFFCLTRTWYKFTLTLHRRTLVYACSFKFFLQPTYTHTHTHTSFEARSVWNFGSNRCKNFLLAIICSIQPFEIVCCLCLCVCLLLTLPSSRLFMLIWPRAGQTKNVLTCLDESIGHLLTLTLVSFLVFIKFRTGFKMTWFFFFFFFLFWQVFTFWSFKIRQTNKLVHTQTAFFLSSLWAHIVLEVQILIVSGTQTHTHAHVFYAAFFDG